MPLGTSKILLSLEFTLAPLGVVMLVIVPPVIAQVVKNGKDVLVVTVN